MEIAKNMLLADILRSYPASLAVFEKYNMGCVSCLGVQNETLERGCQMHGIDLNAMLADLNQAINAK